MKKRILIVDDSVYMRQMIRTSLEKSEYEIVGEAATGEVAIELAIELNPDLITLDNVLPDMFGKEILKTLIEEEIHSDILMISAVGQDAVKKEEIEIGALDYIVKPFSEELLLQVVDKILNKQAVA